MKVAVTGATGFLGKALVKELIDLGFSVSCLSRTNYSPNFQTNAPTRLEWHHIDYDNRESLQKALQGCEALVHLAGIAHSKATDADKLRYEQGICRATEAIQEAAIHAQVRTFIFASSIKVYGERSLNRAFTELDIPHPDSLYGKCKLKAEAILQNDNSAMAKIVFRFPPLFGQNMKGSIKHIFEASRYHLPLPFHSFHHKRHFLFVKNASALILAGIRLEIKPGLYNVYDPVAWKLGDFYREVYLAIHGRPLPRYLSWKLPLGMEKALRHFSGLTAMMNPFELESIYFAEWSKFLKYTPRQSIQEIAKDMRVARSDFLLSKSNGT